MNLGSAMLLATSDDMKYGMQNVECRMMNRCEKYRLICNFFIDCMKIETNQWEWEKRV
jgi:hypothetical protein